MNSHSNSRFSLAVVTSLFFLWGFITCMNDLLIPHFKGMFDLSRTQAMMVQFAFFGAYFIGSVIYFLISLVQGDPINKIGYKRGIVVGLLISAVGCGLFYPAAQLGAYWMFLGGLFVLGLGFTLLQIAANPYVSILGTSETASSRLNLTQGFNSLGTTLAPLLGVAMISMLVDEGGQAGESVKYPYLLFSGIFVLMAIGFSRINLPHFQNDASLSGGSAIRFPQVYLGVLAIFTYVGAEVTIGSFLIEFIGMSDVMGLGEDIAANYLACYWGGAMVGRFSGALSLSKLSSQKKWLGMVAGSLVTFGLIWQLGSLSLSEIAPFLLFVVLNILGFIWGKGIPGKTLGGFALVNVGLILGTIFLTGAASMWMLLAVGLFNSIMWPNIFTLSIHNLGKHTSQASSLLVMAILGGALVPVLQGWLSEFAAIGVKGSFFLPMACYAYIAFFGFRFAGVEVSQKEEQPAGVSH
ncbi:sugar MFS transporter [Pontibacter sp. G13]|uniref:sugar MFS transporter n=1 Tax=Pontibacter sp. G13 TaxID=3074898 RepID=UPI00288BA00D|nr:sugar MFS transporter [Pontibacter sp. G13]WNJ18909.1 sugar MFS transporter [Pontibacter sp. G13]